MNAIVYDFPARNNDVFADRIIEKTNESWSIIGMEKGINELAFVWRIFISRNKYDKIVFWQQRHGIYYANLCNVFHVKKGPKTYILTFIYKEDNGLKGWLKYLLYKETVKSKCITNLICYSKYEVEYYREKFIAPVGKIVSTTFGLNDQKYRNGEAVTDNDGFILDVGRSNRDHKFLEEALAGTNYSAVIADRTYFSDGNSNCNVVRDVKYGENLYSLIEKSFVVIVPLADENISAGQTVFVQAMMFSKPIIVTSSNTIDEYVIDGENGFVINKSKDSLIKALDLLTTNDDLYYEMCKKSREMFEKNFSFDALGRNVGNIIIDSIDYMEK